MRLEVRVSEEQLERWKWAAEEEGGLPVSAWLRRCADEQVELLKAIRRDEAGERRRGRELHGLDPSEARRRDWGRNEPHRRRARP